MNHEDRGRLRVLLGLAVVAGVLMISAPIAQAAKISSDAGTYSCVKETSLCKGNLGTLAKGTSVTMQCWYDGRPPAGGYSVRWFLVRRDSDGYEAFIHSSKIAVSQQTKVGWCWDSRRVRAALTALDRVGATQPSPSDVKAGGWTMYAPSSNLSGFGPAGDWAGDCAKLAWLAYAKAGQSLTRNNAWLMFTPYYNNSTLKSKGRTPYPAFGALVGFNGKPGHIAIAVGGNYIASTQGTDSQTKGKPGAAVTRMKIPSSYGGPYYGWVVPY